MGHSTAANIPYCKAEFEKFKAAHPDLDTNLCIELFVRDIIAPSRPSPPRRRAVSDANGTQRSPATAQGRVRKTTKHQNGTTMIRGPSRYAAEMGRSFTTQAYTFRSTAQPSTSAPMSCSMPTGRLQHSSVGNDMCYNQQNPNFSVPNGRMNRGDFATYRRTGVVPTPSIDIPVGRNQLSPQSMASSIDSSAALSSLETTPPIPTPVNMSRNISNGSFTQGIQMMRLQSDGFSTMRTAAPYFDDEDQLFPMMELDADFDGELNKSSANSTEWENTSPQLSSQSSSQPSHSAPMLDHMPGPQSVESPEQKRELPPQTETIPDRSAKASTASVEQQQPTQTPAQRNSRRSMKYIRKPHPRVYCPQCPDNKDGFRGEHEFRRHFDRMHAEVKKVWIVKDLTPDKRLSKCKACKNQKRYNTDYNATAHLRRQHFNPERDPKVKVPANLRDWVESIEIEPTEQEKKQWKIDDQKQRMFDSSPAQETADVDGEWQQLGTSTVPVMGDATASLVTEAADAMFAPENIAMAWPELQYDGFNVDDLTSFADNFQLSSFNEPSQDQSHMPIYTDFSDARLFTTSGSTLVPDNVDLVSMNTQILRGGFLPSTTDDMTQWLT